MNSDTQDQDCAVCLQRCHHPTQLPCGHIFCFLCVKGIALQSKKCAMCRAAIPPDYLDHPVLLEKLTMQSSADSNGEYQWHYEGRNGWWKYDERSNIELEAAFNSGETECTLLIAGALYTIDFQNMVQVRHSDSTRRRHVRRDTSALPVKGIAGIKNLDRQPSDQTKDSDENNSNEIINSELSHDEIIEIEDEVVDLTQDDNITHSPEPHNAVDNIIQQLSSIDLTQSDTPETQNSITEDT